MTGFTLASPASNLQAVLEVGRLGGAFSTVCQCGSYSPSLFCSQEGLM